MSLAVRINILCEKEGSQSNFAKKIGIQRQTISRIVNKGTGIRSDTIEAIAIAYPKLNLRWLILGEEPIWFAENIDSNKDNQGKDTSNEMPLKMINLLETKVRVLEREVRRLDPDLARELGIV